MASTVYLLAIVNLLPNDIGPELIKAMSLAQVIAAFLSFGGRQRILNAYSARARVGGETKHIALKELVSYVNLGVLTSALILIMFVLTSQSQYLAVVVCLGLMISISELVFHYHLSNGNLTGFPVYYGIFFKVAHILILIIFIRLLGWKLNVDAALGVALIVHAIILLREWAHHRYRLAWPLMSDTLKMPAQSYAYWFNSVVAIAFLNVPQYIISGGNNISDINFYRILVAGPLLASLVTQVLLPPIVRGRPETRGEAGWPVPNVIPNGCQSQFGEPHVDTGHPAAA
ncbi:hypothetical protein [Oricola indica]|uniref:hypothetical protein n=1 Tax=Oricola indica TaxID=2872591 RepID=UPI003CCC32AF